jgi:hypothetical protein
MPTPISDALSSALRSDSTVALAALMVIATAHRDLFAWAAKALAEPAEPPSAPKARSNGAARHETKARKPPGAAYHARRRKARDHDDEALIEAMRSAPDASISDWAAAIGKGRSSTVSALKRLRDAGMTESVQGKWRLNEPVAPLTPPPKWVAPLIAAREHRAHA